MQCSKFNSFGSQLTSDLAKVRPAAVEAHAQSTGTAPAANPTVTPLSSPGQSIIVELPLIEVLCFTLLPQQSDAAPHGKEQSPGAGTSAPQGSAPEFSFPLRPSSWITKWDSTSIASGLDANQIYHRRQQQQHAPVAIWSRSLAPTVSFAVLAFRAGRHQSIAAGISAKVQCAGLLGTNLQEKRHGRQHFFGTFSSQCTLMTRRARDIRRLVLEFPLTSLSNQGAEQHHAYLDC